METDVSLPYSQQLAADPRSETILLDSHPSYFFKISFLSRYFPFCVNDMNYISLFYLFTPLRSILIVSSNVPFDIPNDFFPSTIFA
jgi:hypothetical protein